MSNKFVKLKMLSKRRGTSGVAYALLSGLIAIGVIGSLTVLGNNTGSVFGVAGDAVSNASSGGSGSGSGSGGGSSSTAPTISNITDASIAPNGTYGPVGFTISDSETAAGSLTVTGSSSNQTLVPDGNITLGGADGSRTITIVPGAGQSGSATITVTVDDGTDTASDTFVLTVVLPTCSGSLSAGDACGLSGEEVVFVSNYDPGDGGGSRPLYVQHCDQCMTWSGSSCTGSRSGIAWNNGNSSNYVDTSASNDVYDDGAEFTSILLSEDSDSGTSGIQPHQAAASCDGLGSGWFLPARDELSQIYTNRNAGDLNGTFDLSGSFYWSSSENTNTSAWLVRLSDGFLITSGKSPLLSVRCVRR